MAHTPGEVSPVLAPIPRLLHSVYSLSTKYMRGACPKSDGQKKYTHIEKK